MLSGEDAGAVDVETAVHPDHRPPPAMRPEPDVEALWCEIVGQHLRVVGEESPRRGRVRLHSGQAGGPETGFPVGGRSAAQRLHHRGRQDGIMSRPGGTRGEAGIVCEVRPLHDGEPAAPFPVGGQGQEDPSLSRRVEAVAGARPEELIIEAGR